jgi:hypothetical protein
VLLAADVKHIAWSGDEGLQAALRQRRPGGSVSFAQVQDWKDQTVLNLGMPGVMPS